MFTFFYHWKSAPQFKHFEVAWTDKELTAWLRYMRAFGNISFIVVRNSDKCVVWSEK